MILCGLELGNIAVVNSQADYTNATPSGSNTDWRRLDGGGSNGSGEANIQPFRQVDRDAITATGRYNMNVTNADETVVLTVEDDFFVTGGNFTSIIVTDHAGTATTELLTLAFTSVSGVRTQIAAGINLVTGVTGVDNGDNTITVTGDVASIEFIFSTGSINPIHFSTSAGEVVSNASGNPPVTSTTSQFLVRNIPNAFAYAWVADNASDTSIPLWDGASAYSVGDDVIFNNNLYRANTAIAAAGGTPRPIGNITRGSIVVFDSPTTPITDNQAIRIRFSTATAPITTDTYELQFAVHGTQYIVTFLGSNVLDGGTTTGTPTTIDGFDPVDDSQTHWYIGRANITNFPSALMGNSTFFDAGSVGLSRPTGGSTNPNPDGNASWDLIGGRNITDVVPEWTSGGTISDGEVYYYRGIAEGDEGSFWRATADLHGPGNSTAPGLPDASNLYNWVKVGESIVEATQAGLNEYGYGTIVLDNSTGTGNTNGVWIQTSLTPDNYDPTAANWVNLADTGNNVTGGVTSITVPGDVSVYARNQHWHRYSRWCVCHWF